PRKNKTAINIEYMKASIRARVEHPFRIIKRQFGFVKARYKGLLKNDNQLAMFRCTLRLSENVFPTRYSGRGGMLKPL
ncbi:transposase, partial [Klebsiella quasivariicola]|uniref:transposase n=1 Tax=Klebsiella quasivariicola TaxID=2026240 RepID=UPI0035B500ED